MTHSVTGRGTVPFENEDDDDDDDDCRSMRTEYTRQTRWGHDPEEVDPDLHPPGGIYVKQVIWVPCNECDLQVHAALTQFFGGGVTCPECGGRLTSPRVLGNPDVAVARIAEVEDILRDGVEPGTPFLENE